MGILVEVQLGVRNATPRGIPSIDNNHVDIAVFCQKFGELVLDELHLLRSKVEVANVIAFTVQQSEA